MRARLFVGLLLGALSLAAACEGEPEEKAATFTLVVENAADEDFEVFLKPEDASKFVSEGRVDVGTEVEIEGLRTEVEYVLRAAPVGADVDEYFYEDAFQRGTDSYFTVIILSTE
jgi:hypothetical protein